MSIDYLLRFFNTPDSIKPGQVIRHRDGWVAVVIKWTKDPYHFKSIHGGEPIDVLYVEGCCNNGSAFTDHVSPFDVEAVR